jgi:hypothetical protein
LSPNNKFNKNIMITFSITCLSFFSLQDQQHG